MKHLSKMYSRDVIIKSSVTKHKSPDGDTFSRSVSDVNMYIPVYTQDGYGTNQSQLINISAADILSLAAEINEIINSPITDDEKSDLDEDLPW